MKPLKTVSDLQSLVTAYQPAEIINTAFDMGIFAAIASNGPQTLDQLSETCEAFPRSLALLLNACVGLGLLEHLPDGCYDNSPLAVQTLAPGGSEFLGNFIRLQHDVRGRWAKLRDGVIYNRRVNAGNREREDGSVWEWNQTFILGIHDVARANAKAIAGMLAPILEKQKVRKLVDIGGGSGAYSTALAAKMPALQVKLLDLEGPLRVTSEILQREGFSNRIELEVADFHTDPLGKEKEYDAALLFGVLHSESAPNRAALLAKVRQVLKPGGLLVLRTPLLNPDCNSPLQDTISALQTLISTDKGAVPVMADLQGLLEQGGFSSVKLKPIPGTELRLILANRPAKG